MKSIATPEDIPVELIETIRAHAAQAAPNECCGLVVRAEVGLCYLPCTNHSRNGKDTFVIGPEDYARAEDLGEVVLVVHSHPFASPAPSEVDRLVCAQGDTPWLIVNHPVGHFHLMQPEPYELPLLGRPFHHGVTDCYALVRDYYRRECLIALPHYDRADQWWMRGDNLYIDNFQQAGFVRVDDAPRRHDAFLMQVRAPVPNHAAIYLGDEIILHHLWGRLSSREVYGDFWRRLTMVHLRHESLL